jgi:hypothetical protein
VFLNPSLVCVAVAAATVVVVARPAAVNAEAAITIISETMVRVFVSFCIIFFLLAVAMMPPFIKTHQFTLLRYNRCCN